jgi:hypothetical protein
MQRKNEEHLMKLMMKLGLSVPTGRSGPEAIGLAESPPRGL